jgi:hypothetical protein
MKSNSVHSKIKVNNMNKIKILFTALFISRLVLAQSIVIDSGASIEVGSGADVCAGVYGNITGNLFGDGTQCNQIMVTTFQLAVNVANGWNIVSVPGLNTPNQNVNTWWQYRDMGANVFKFSGGYQSVTDVVPGTGYWMKHSGARTYNTGEEWPVGGIQIVPHAPLTVASGWNLIGGYELSVTAANVTTIPSGLQSGPIYKYSGGYQTATTLDPGYGYWMKLTGAGQIIIPETLAKESKPVEWFPKDWGKIVFIDAESRSFVLYCASDDFDLTQYELPPVPPSEMFDIRFESGRIAEDIITSEKSIVLNGVKFPLTIRVENIDLKFQDESGKQINANQKSGEGVLISDATIKKLTVSVNQIPDEYALEQNYPNPFNPSTTINFSLPKQTQLKIRIYNMLGEQVATIAEGMYEAGYHKVTFNASNLPSGTYIYRIESNNFVQVKKMILIK